MLDWESLEQACKNCTKCGLCETKTNKVFGVGCRESKILFVGEGPGEQEDLRGEPFVGPAGMLLDDMLSIIDLDRTKNCYIANIVKCRPPQNRDPLPSEEAACMDFLRRQIALIEPQMIVCLGRISAAKLIKPDFKITKEHGTLFERDGVLMSAVYHPALLLRDPRKKPEMLEDMRAIKQKLDALS